MGRPAPAQVKTKTAKAQAIVILGCPSSSRLRRRLDRGIDLFRQGLAPALVLSGGGSGSTPEAEIMRGAAKARGIPESALLVEPYSRDTIGNARETARLLRRHGWRAVILVTDENSLATRRAAVSPRRGRGGRALGRQFVIGAARILNRAPGGAGVPPQPGARPHY